MGAQWAATTLTCAPLVGAPPFGNVAPHILSGYRNPHTAGQHCGCLNQRMSHSEPRTARSGRWFIGPLLALVLTLVGASCSNGPASKTAASNFASGEPTTTAGDLNEQGVRAGDPHEQGVRYADCMRQHGVRNFPDPDASGKFPDFGVDVSRDQWLSTVTACKDLQPPSVDYSSERTFAQQSAALKFAQCIRDNGVKDFPDPENGEPLIDTTKIPSARTAAGKAILNAATKTCGALLNAAAQGRP